MSTVTAQLVVRMFGVDEDVTIRCGDDPASWTRQLAYVPKPEVGELAALAGWTTSASGATQLPAEFQMQADKALTAKSLDARWQTDAAQMMPGHGGQNGSWVPDMTGTSASGFTCCSCRLILRKNQTGSDSDLALVGGLMLRIEYWVSLTID